LGILSQLDEYFGQRFGIWVSNRGFDRLNLIEPIILLTDMVAANTDQALDVRNRYAKRWVGCETSVQFLKRK